MEMIIINDNDSKEVEQLKKRNEQLRQQLDHLRRKTSFLVTLCLENDKFDDAAIRETVIKNFIPSVQRELSKTLDVMIE